MTETPDLIELIRQAGLRQIENGSGLDVDRLAEVVEEIRSAAAPQPRFDDVWTAAHAWVSEPSADDDDAMAVQLLREGRALAENEVDFLALVDVILDAFEALDIETVETQESDIPDATGPGFVEEVVEQENRGISAALLSKAVRFQPPTTAAPAAVAKVRRPRGRVDLSAPQGEDDDNPFAGGMLPGVAPEVQLAGPLKTSAPKKASGHDIPDLPPAMQWKRDGAGRQVPPGQEVDQ